MILNGIICQSNGTKSKPAIKYCYARGVRLQRFIVHYLESIDPRALLAALFLVTCLLGVIHYYVGPELSFSVFYTGPIMIAVWYGGRTQGVVIAIAAAVIWLLADVAVSPPYSHTLIPLWNTLVRFAFFAIIMSLLLTVKRKLALEESLADTDPLTGLANRRLFQEQLEHEYVRVQRYPEPYTIAYIDLDNFKYINDSLGHDVGDELLRKVAVKLDENIRATDLVARLGGDEFALLLPVLDSRSSVTVLKNIQESLQRTMDDNLWPVTFSIGAITFEDTMESTRDMVKAVDDLMYKVKKEGKNNLRFEVWPTAANQ